MNFLGINLGAIPSWNPIDYINSGAGIHTFLLLLIPVLSALTSYIYAKYSMKNASESAPKTDENQMPQMQAFMQKNMALLSPVMSGVIAFTVVR